MGRKYLALLKKELEWTTPSNVLLVSAAISGMPQADRNVKVTA